MLKQGISMGAYIRGGPIQMGAYIRDFTVSCFSVQDTPKEKRFTAKIRILTKEGIL